MKLLSLQPLPPCSFLNHIPSIKCPAFFFFHLTQNVTPSHQPLLPSVFPIPTVRHDRPTTSSWHPLFTTLCMFTLLFSPLPLPNTLLLDPTLTEELIFHPVDLQGFGNIYTWWPLTSNTMNRLRLSLRALSHLNAELTNTYSYFNMLFRLRRTLKPSFTHCFVFL